jgi:hypothetical protein
MSRATNEDLAMFAQVNANQPRMLAWLESERATAIKCLTGARDVVVMHRYQGEVNTLDKLIALLKDANSIIAKMKGAT